VLLAVTGLTMGISYAAAGGPLGSTPGVVGAAMAYVPAVWLMTGVAVALVGLFPRGTIAAWLALLLCLVIGILGQLLRLSHWIRDLSPFDHVPRLPAAAAHPLPIVVLLTLSAVLCAAGLLGLRRRDIG
jgi:ABC-2 type transport system permease protein